MKTRLAIAASALTVALSAGCAAAAQSAQDVAPRVRPGFEEMWNDARKDEAKWLRELAESDEAIAKERARLVDGERMVANGAVGAEAQKVAYREFFLRGGIAATARQANGEADALAAIVKAWENHDAAHRKGVDIVEDAQKDLARAEKKRRKASEKIGDARRAMARSELPAPVELRAAPALSGDVVIDDVATDPLVGIVE